MLSLSVITLALSTTLVIRHLLSSGHSSFFLQLHSFCVVMLLLLLRSFLLFLLKTGWRLWFGGRCFLIRLRRVLEYMLLKVTANLLGLEFCKILKKLP